MKPEFSKGDAVIIIDIHPRDDYFSQKDLLLSNKAFIFAPSNNKWIRNKHMREWLSMALTINNEIYWFWGIKIEVPETEEENEIIN